MKKINRQIPQDLDKLKVLEAIRILEKKFGKKWLTKNKKHPLRELWKRKDFLSTSELYVIGLGLKKLLENNEREWLENFVKEVKKLKNIRQLKALCYELFIYTLIENKTRLSKPKQPAFDLTIFTKTQDIRVSIKRLTESDIFIKLKDEFRKCEEYFIQLLNEYDENGYQIILRFDEYKRFSLQKCKGLIQEGLLKKQNLVSKDQSLFIKRIKCKNGSILSSKKRSYLINLIIKKNKKEEERFFNLFKGAIKNLKKGAIRNLKQIESNKNNINMIIIGLPEYISFDVATNWIQNEFNKGIYSSISGVLLTRYLPIHDIKKNTNHLNLEFKFIYNNEAKYKLSKNNLIRLTLPIGTISQGEIITYSLISENSEITFKSNDYYLFQNGYQLCELLTPNNKYDFHYKPDFVEEILIMEKHFSIKPIFPKENKGICL